MRRGLAVAGTIAAAAVAWGYLEAGLVRLERLDVPIPDLPPELDGLRIAHLSDLHLGIPSRGEVAVRRAVEWVAQIEPDLTVISGDLVSRPRGEPILRELLPQLPRCYAVLGNHDLAESRDPFAVATPLDDLSPATLLKDESATVELRGKRVQIVGVDPLTFGLRRSRPETLVDPDADLRVLVSHFPDVVERLPEGAFHLVLAGHLHAGQIVIPLPGRSLRLSHLREPHVHGLYTGPPAVLHVSAGLGTTFVPFRFFARPEATDLVLRAAA